MSIIDAGALWKNQDKKGTTYLGGTIQVSETQKVKVLIYKNDKKVKDIQPDYRVFMLTDDPKPEPQEEPKEELHPDDISF